MTPARLNSHVKDSVLWDMAKQIFYSQRDAQNAIVRMISPQWREKHVDARPGTPLIEYPCQCGNHPEHWHIGHLNLKRAIPRHPMFYAAVNAFLSEIPESARRRMKRKIALHDKYRARKILQRLGMS